MKLTVHAEAADDVLSDDLLPLVDDVGAKMWWVPRKRMIRSTTRCLLQATVAVQRSS